MKIPIILALALAACGGHYDGDPCDPAPARTATQEDCIIAAQWMTDRGCPPMPEWARGCPTAVPAPVIECILGTDACGKMAECLSAP